MTKRTVFNLTLNDVDRVWVACGRALRVNPAIADTLADVLELVLARHPDNGSMFDEHVREGFDVLTLALRAHRRSKLSGAVPPSGEA